MNGSGPESDSGLPVSDYYEWLSMGEELLYNSLLLDEQSYMQGVNRVFGDFLVDAITSLTAAVDRYKARYEQQEAEANAEIDRHVDELARQGDIEVEQAERDHEIFMEMRAQELEDEGTQPF